MRQDSADSSPLQRAQRIMSEALSLAFSTCLSQGEETLVQSPPFDLVFCYSALIRNFFPPTLDFNPSDRLIWLWSAARRTHHAPSRVRGVSMTHCQHADLWEQRLMEIMIRRTRQQRLAGHGKQENADLEVADRLGVRSPRKVRLDCVILTETRSIVGTTCVQKSRMFLLCHLSCSTGEMVFVGKRR